MKDELVSFETAKLAKEKGFDELCKCHFDKYGNEHIEHYTDGNTNSGWYGDACTRPTQSLLQRWLREVHKIDIMIEAFSKEDNSSSYVGWYDDSSGVNDDLKEEDFNDSYEETLEATLQVVLKGLKDA